MQLRQWQTHALSACEGKSSGIISAITGAGKSYVIGRLAAQQAAGRVAVVTPRLALVHQLHASMNAQGLSVGRYCTGHKDVAQRITVVCNDSLNAYRKAIGEPPALALFDEVHRTQATGMREAIGLLGAKRRIGFTATPFRTDEAETLSLWDELLMSYGLAEAWADGVLVPFRIERYQGKATEGLNQACLDMVYDAHGPGVIGAVSIDDAVRYAAWLTSMGFPCGYVHSRRRDNDNARELFDLRTGKIRAVTHVNMLSEGVDLPWLRWLCLRRNITSRVMFPQTVGRVLRTMPEPDQWGIKRDAVVFDPLHLFGQHKMASPAALGDAPPIEPRAQSMASLKRSRMEVLRDPVAVRATAAWLRDVLLVMETAGMLSAPLVFATSTWRMEPVSDQQHASLTRLKRYAGRLPFTVRESVVGLVEGAQGVLTAGEASDALCVLSALAKATRASGWKWRWPKGVPLPELTTEAG